MSSPSSRIRPSSIGSSRLMQRSSVLLPDPDAPIREITSPVVDVEVDAVEHDGASPNDLTTPSSDSLAGRRSSITAGPDVRRAAARSRWSVEPGQRDRHGEEDHGGGDVRREVDVLGLVDAGLAQDLDRADEADRATSFWRLTKSFISGGTTRRTAWGRTTARIVWPTRQPERAGRRPLASRARCRCRRGTPRRRTPSR